METLTGLKSLKNLKDLRDLENMLAPAINIQLKYALEGTNISLKEFIENSHRLNEIEKQVKNTNFNEPFQEVKSSINKYLEKELRLVELFESTKQSFHQILQEKELDQEYFKCVETSDKKRMEEIVKFAAEKNDHKHTVYRGDDKPYNDYTESLRRCWEDKSCGGALGRGLYFASTERYADIFGAKARYKGVTRQFFIKANFVDLDAEGVGDFIMEYQAPYIDEIKRLDEAAEPYRKGRKPDEPKHPAVLAYDIHVDKLQNQVFKAIKEKFGGDSVCVKEYGLFARDGEYEYNIQNPKHIKLTDLITQDDNGKIIPPSKRFDTNSSDVRGLTKKELLKLPVRKGLEYIAKDTYYKNMPQSIWETNLLKNAMTITETHITKKPANLKITRKSKDLEDFAIL